MTADEIATHAGEIRSVGYTVVPGVLTSDETSDISGRLDALLRRQADEFGGESRLAAIGDALTVRCPLAYDDVFLRVATDERLLRLCRALLGDYIVLMQQNAIVNPPDGAHAQQQYHRDLPYQQFVSSRPLGISALVCIDPFRPETGATVVLPGSHRVEAAPSPAEAETREAPVTADAGSCIVFDSMLFHRAGDNRSGKPRRAVNHVFTVPIIAQQISLPAMLAGRYSDEPALARLLGYDSMPAASVIEWRERRLRRQRASEQRQ
jgi:ectoine hydroxylase-related dioxygenase (phytanoyl-CoA dioxygenase family)